jgi:hypothetical protein
VVGVGWMRLAARCDAHGTCCSSAPTCARSRARRRPP